MKIYIAIDKKTHKLCDRFSLQTDSGDVFREIVEYDDEMLKKFDVAEFDLKNIKPSKILRSEDSEYYCEDEDEA